MGSGLSRQQVVELASKNMEIGEDWHKKTNVREIVFGFNDGSISTLALLAGVVGGALTREQALIAGFSGVFAGSISMAIGAYISTKSEIEHYQSEIEREKQEIKELPDVEREEIRQIYADKGAFSEEELDLIVDRLTRDEDIFLDVMMKEELGLFEDRFESPFKVGAIMFIAFLLGGLVPLVPFALIPETFMGLVGASIVTLLALFLVGVWKTTFTLKTWWVSGGEMVLIGLAAAVIPYLLGDLLLENLLIKILG